MWSVKKIDNNGFFCYIKKIKIEEKIDVMDF